MTIRELITAEFETIAQHLGALRDLVYRDMLEGEGGAAPPSGAPPASEVRLNVPWVSQVGTGAQYAAGDCAMACVTMVLRAHGVAVTVDAVSKASGLLPGFTQAAWWDAVHAAAAYHLVLDHGYDLKLDDVVAEVRAGRPVIAIVNYQSIPARLRSSATYDAGHFVVVVGLDDAPSGAHVLVHDPFWPESQAERGAFIPFTRGEFETAWTTLAPGNKLGRQVLKVKP